MRILLALCFCSTLALAQKMLVQPAAGAGPKNPAEQQALDKLVDLLSEQIQEAIPCSEPTTMEEVRDLMRDAKDKELLGTSTGKELGEILQKVGVNDLVSVNVTQLGNQMVATVSWMDMSTARVKARDTAPLSGDDASLDRFAQKFASSMKSQSGNSSGKDCQADKEWYGTLRGILHKKFNKDENEPNCTTHIESEDTWRATIRIPRKGPSTAFATLIRKGVKDSTCTIKGSCGKTPDVYTRYAHQVEEVFGGSRVEAITFFEAPDNLLRGDAALGIMPATLKLSGINEWKNSNCGPNRSETVAHEPGEIQVSAPSFTLPGQKLQPGQRVSRGSFQEKDLTLEWRLIRTDYK